jgi:YVTN family beta-propeller protein
MRGRTHMMRLVCACMAFAAATAAAQTTPKAALLALSKRDHTLAVVDPRDMHVVARVPVGDDPHEVVASADGTTAYVSDYGFGAFHTLAVIDLRVRTPLPSIDLGALEGPHGLVFEGGKVWFTAEAARAVGSYDPAAGKIDWIMGTGQDRTHMLWVSPDTKRVVTTNVNSATVTVMDETEPQPGGPPPGTGPGGTPPAGAMPGPPPGPPPPPRGPDWHLTVVPVGRGCEGFDVSPDGMEAWVANARDGTVSVVDLATRKVVATLDVGVSGANRLKFTPDGTRVLISAGALVVMDTSTRQVVKRLESVHATGGIQMQPDGARAWAACGRDGYVAVVDLKTLEMVGKVDVAGPDGLAWAERR